jgi:hypothetical protein
MGDVHRVFGLLVHIAGPQPLAGKQVTRLSVRDHGLNPYLVMVAFSPRFPIASGPHDSKQIDVTQTRKNRYSQQAQNDRWVSGKWPDGPDGRAVERAAPVR